ncbi:MarR family winged helix-turn-helix transcriptional regulator [Nocardiopsis sp. MG754419]|uniref:MarR family winged helix-turn-helix transcriptional regulator n=1 Tax=Nocardiopsis sp. MG754419 TaxID=2259865 RepID=UPI001BA55AD4|nr:MarR family transcriptional regulator [Nocardiopsis sp. MG754419]MBR8743903.1 MarR family transcriptional regulator [Nocardiopsis sp. MG754419]
MSDLPIGYWLKHLDRLIESDLDRVLAAESLGRRQWQVLSSLRNDPTTLLQLGQRLLPFLEEGESTVGPEVEALRRRGWVSGLVSLELTPEGERVHDALLEQVTQTRSRLTEGISEQEYRATIEVLERMAANLEQG